MKEVFIFGYYGYDNKGDEAILEAFIKSFKEEISRDTKINVLTYNAKKTSNSFKVNGVSRNNYKEIIKKIYSSDYLISAGGSLLQDTTSSLSLYYYLIIVFIGKILRKKVVFFNNGFGPINKKTNKLLLKFFLNKVDLIITRDKSSKIFLEDLGVKKDIKKGADLAFLLKGSNEIKKDMSKEEKVIGISVRKWNSNSHVKEFAKLCDLLIESGYKVKLYPMQYDSDLEISREIKKLSKNDIYIKEKEESIDSLLEDIASLDILVGMRLHSLIFATIVNIPAIGIEYDPKIKNFMKESNQLYGCHIDDIDHKLLYEKIEMYLKSFDEEKMIKKSSKLREEANLGFEFLKIMTKEDI